MILILTSNLGSQYLIDPISNADEKRENVMAIVRSTFKPEFLNRLDDIVMFDALNMKELSQIVGIQLQQLQQRLSNRRISLDVSSSAKNWLAERGFDPIYGARPLRRLLQTEVGDRLAKSLLSGEFVDGQQIEVDLVGDRLELHSV